MRSLIPFAIALPVLLAPAALAQDFLGQFETFVEDLVTPPKARPGPAASEDEAAPPVPRPRPPSLPDVPIVTKPQPPAVAAEPVVEQEPVQAPEPEPGVVTEPAEPERVYQVACPAVLDGLVEATMAPPLSEGICGEQSPLLVTGVLVRGRMVPLSSPITTNCEMASALPGWAGTVDGYADAMLESGLAGIETGTGYMCRNRNNAGGGFTSEHGFANAVDVTGFTLEDGRSIGVEADWMPAAAPEGRLLRLAHDAACGSFTTVLGPEANAEHADHLHLDLGCHGAACTARICE